MAKQSTLNDPLSLGVFCGVFLTIAAAGGHWFITPDAWRLPTPTWERIFTGIQIVVSLGVSIWSYARARRLLANGRAGPEQSRA